MRRFVRGWAVAGLLVPAMIYLAWYLDPLGGNDYLVRLVWPSSIMTMAIHYPGIDAIVIVTISILINVALYSGVGAATWFLFCKPSHRPRME